MNVEASALGREHARNNVSDITSDRAECSKGNMARISGLFLSGYLRFALDAYFKKLVRKFLKRIRQIILLYLPYYIKKLLPIERNVKLFP